MISDSLQDRVRELIADYHGGSVNSAAKAIGVPQQTLAQIVDGKVRFPRGNTLQKIADGHAVSIDWLLTGRGQGPQANDAHGMPVSGAILQWYRLVDALISDGYMEPKPPYSPSGKWGLSEEEERALLHVTLYFMAAEDYLVLLLLGVGPAGSAALTGEEIAPAVDARARRCIEVFEQLIARVGDVGVVSRLREFLPSFAIGMNTAPSMDQAEEKAVLARLAQAALEMLPTFPHRSVHEAAASGGTTPTGTRQMAPKATGANAGRKGTSARRRRR